MIRTALLATMAAAVALTVTVPAHAEGGCGRAWHRGPYGGCRPNYGPGPVVVGPVVGPAVVAPGIVIGGFYPGRGYWDGHRYWGHRYAWRGGWRYR